MSRSGRGWRVAGYESDLAALRWSSERLKSATTSMASINNVFVLFVPFLSFSFRVAHQSLARLTCIANNREVELTTEVEVVLGGRLGEAIGDLMGGRNPLDLDEQILGRQRDDGVAARASS